MKLLARMVLVLAGSVYLPAVLAGRLVSAKGGDFVQILKAEATGVAAGLLVGWALMSLGRKRRPAPARIFSDLMCLCLGAIWLILFADAWIDLPEKVWRWAGSAWLAVGGLTVLVWILARGAWIDPRAYQPPSRPLE